MLPGGTSGKGCSSTYREPASATLSVGLASAPYPTCQPERAMVNKGSPCSRGPAIDKMEHKWTRERTHLGSIKDGRGEALARARYASHVCVTEHVRGRGRSKLASTSARRAHKNHPMPANNCCELDLSILWWQKPCEYRVVGKFSDPNSDRENYILEPIHINIDVAQLQPLALDPDAYGRALTEMFFNQCEGAIREVYAKARAAAGARDGLRMRLSIEKNARELHAVRWETLRDPTQDIPLLTQSNVWFSRFVSGETFSTRTSSGSGKVGALVVIANPSDIHTKWGQAQLDSDCGLRGHEAGALCGTGCAGVRGLAARHEGDDLQHRFEPAGELLARFVSRLSWATDRQRRTAAPAGERRGCRRDRQGRAAGRKAGRPECAAATDRAGLLPERGRTGRRCVWRAGATPGAERRCERHRDAGRHHRRVCRQIHQPAVQGTVEGRPDRSRHGGRAQRHT